jgi:hypothetical protein
MDEAADQARWRNLVSFAVIGLLNNVVFAISNASASNLLPDAIGLVFVINTAPGLAVKLLAPLWVDMGSYSLKFCLVGISLAFNLLVLLTPTPMWLKLVGVAIGDAGSSAGEATCMAMSQFYVQPQRHISFFAMGTGFSGVSGYVLKMWILPAAGSTASLIIGAVLVLTYWLTYFVVMDAPWIDSPKPASELGTAYAIMEEEPQHSSFASSTPWTSNSSSTPADFLCTSPNVGGQSTPTDAVRYIGPSASADMLTRRIPIRNPLAVSADSLPLRISAPLDPVRRIRIKSRELIGASDSSLDGVTSAVRETDSSTRPTAAARRV